MHILDAYREVRSSHSEYIRLPARLAEQAGVREEDTFTMEPRLDRIRRFLSKHRPVGRIVDIGSNSGFFSLSLLDEGLASEAVLYELNPTVSRFSAAVAEALGKADKTRAVVQGISIDTLDELPDGDVINCQNLIHHAGATFDVAQVSALGWEEYARRFLVKLREKYRLGVIAVGFKGAKPVNWNTPQSSRPTRFRQLLRDAGWDPVFDRNFHDLATGRSSEPTAAARAVMGAAWRVAGTRGERLAARAVHWGAPDKSAKYHLFLAE